MKDGEQQLWPKVSSPSRGLLSGHQEFRGAEGSPLPQSPRSKRFGSAAPKGPMHSPPAPIPSWWCGLTRSFKFPPRVRAKPLPWFPQSCLTRRVLLCSGSLMLGRGGCWRESEDGEGKGGGQGRPEEWTGLIWPFCFNFPDFRGFGKGGRGRLLDPESLWELSPFWASASSSCKWAPAHPVRPRLFP